MPPLELWSIGDDQGDGLARVDLRVGGGIRASWVIPHGEAERLVLGVWVDEITERFGFLPRWSLWIV